jgi:hypothetical protein
VSLGTPEIQKKFVDGPVCVLYVRPNGAIQLGPFLLKWILYSAVASALSGYVAKSVLHAGDSHLAVFRVVGVSAWLAYAWQSPSDSIWKGKPWHPRFETCSTG